LSLPAEHVAVLPNPVDRYQFRPRSRMLEQDGLIVFVGTVCEKKGVRQLIEAMPHILKAVPHARLWIVGRDSHDSATGCSFSAALRACCPPAVESRISFKGAIEHDSIPHLLAKAVVCAYPSQMEAMSIATVEAMSMAKAVVATHAGPGPELIHNGRSGLLCDPADPGSIAEQIVRLLLDPKLRRRLGDAARIRVTLDFAADVLVDRNVEFYGRCIDTFCRLVRRPEIHRLTSCHSSADE
jgi:glycosyltransferase involved in cell wall biosynthesis